MKKNKTMSGKKLAMAGAGAAVLGAAGAGAYYLLGPKGKKHQKKAAVLMAKMKKEVTSEIKKAEKISTPIFHKTVDAVSKNYAKQYGAHEKEIKAFASMLKGEWKELTLGRSHTGEAKKPAQKAVKKTAKISKNKNTK
jgi:hypothetical protein